MAYKIFLPLLLAVMLFCMTACENGTADAVDAAAYEEAQELHIGDVVAPMSEADEETSLDSISRNVYSPKDTLPDGMKLESELSKDDDPQVIYIGKPRSKKAKESAEDEEDDAYDEYYEPLFSKGSELGIDVSKYNKDIDWEQVKNFGVSYAIIRCAYRGSTTGYMVMDPKWEDNYLGARRAGIKTGAYFFTQAISEEEAVKEASLVCALIKGTGLDLPVFIDVEGSGGRADPLERGLRTQIISAFIRTIQNEGYKAGVYANKSWFTGYINREELPPGTYIWYAQYNVQKPTYTGSYDIWQYSSKGTVPGIEGFVDMNISQD